MPKYELKIGAATREAWGKALVELGRENPNVVVCDADLAKSTFTHLFQKEFPERFFSCGIAESNMVSIGAGMAASGKLAFVASFAAFVINKGFEQLRVTVAYPNVNLKVVGTHAGISIGEDGPSQMSAEDLGLACALAGFVVLSPADEVSMFALVKAAAAHVGPVYIRAGRTKVPVIYDANQKFEIGKSIQLTDGNDVTIISHGLMVAESLKAAEILLAEGIGARVIDMHTIKPLDHEAITRAAVETGAIAVVEEHFVKSGLGVLVAQVVAETHHCAMAFFGVDDRYAESGTPEQLLEHYHMNAAAVVNAARQAMMRKK